MLISLLSWKPTNVIVDVLTNQYVHHLVVNTCLFNGPLYSFLSIILHQLPCLLLQPLTLTTISHKGHPNPLRICNVYHTKS